MWARLGSMAIGIWLMAAPAALGYGDPARTINRILGPLAASAAIVALSEVTREVRWLEAAVGLVLLVSPWLLGYPVTPAVHSLAAGGFLIGLGATRGSVSQRFGGGWSSLLRRERLARH
jgi:SPW repeat